MPEYSSTTITPADSVKVPAMNGSTSGNFQLDALRSFILASKGAANGLASLDSSGKLAAAQIPDSLDDVLVYASKALLPGTGTAGKLYITADDNVMYRWDPDLATPDYVQLSVDLSLYATKAELAAEESAREAADSDLKNALDATNKRVTNLEHKEGDYEIVNYPSSTYGRGEVPSDALEYAPIEKVYGVMRVHNQHVKNYNFADGTNNWNVYSAYRSSITASGNELTQTFISTAGSAFEYGVVQNYVLPNFTDDYLVVFSIEPSFTSSFVIELGGGSPYTTDVLPANTKSVIAFKRSPASYNSSILIYPSDLTTVLNQTAKYQFITVKSVNQYFGGTIPSNATTIAGIQQYYSELLIPSDYDAGTVKISTYSGGKSVGMNIVDSVFEDGGFDSDGNESAISQWKRTKNYAKCEPSTAYYFKQTGTASYATLVCYDINKNVVEVKSGGTGGIADGATFTTPSNAHYLRMAMTTAYGDIGKFQVCLNSASDKTTFHEYMTDSISFPSSVSIKGIGNCVESYEPSTGVMDDGKISHVNLGDYDWDFNQEGTNTYECYNSNFPKALGVSNMICNRLVVTGYADDSAYGIRGYASSGTVSVRVPKNVASSPSAMKQWLHDNNVVMYFELSTPSAPSSPLAPIDSYLKVEPYGTVEMIHSETPSVDSKFDMGYMYGGN